MGKKTIIAGAVILSALGVWFLALPISDARARAEHEHGIKLPLSARNIQCKGDASRGFLDRGASTMFEMSTNDLAAFVAQLRVRSRNEPTTNNGDPSNGWNVWPQRSTTFVPGNSQYGGFRRTWHGDATPIEMLSCASTTGDWLHVELWRTVEGAMVVKMYTDWN